jgi:Uma2 family endonuclease
MDMMSWTAHVRSRSESRIDRDPLLALLLNLVYPALMSALIPDRARIWTEAELQSLPDEGYIHEVVHGELVMSPKNNFQHEHICERINFALESFNRSHRLGAVFGSSMGFWMANRNCRAPDVSFVTKERLLRVGFKPDTKSFFPGAPDLAVEVMSPGNTRADMDGRLADFFGSGSKLVWIVHPDEQFVEVCHGRSDRRIVGPAGFLEGEDILPGFRLAVSDLFRGWDW